MEKHPENLAFRTEENTLPPMNELPTKHSQDFMRVYGSLVSTSATIFDVSFIFGQAITEDHQNPYIERKVAVTMSWQAAKAFAQLLNSTITSYERQAGEIKFLALPPQSEQPVSE